MIHLILIRHGHTAWNTGKGQDKRFRGTVDLPLADEGVVQAQQTAQRLANVPLAAVYSSPLQRAARTAEIIGQPHGLVVQSLAGLSTMNYGDWAGLYTADVASRWPNLYRQWRQDPFAVQTPGGESAAELRQRALDAVHSIVSRHSDGDTIVLVSHQAVAKTLVCTLAGIPNNGYWLVHQDLCNMSRFDYDPNSGVFAVVGLNDTCHLDSALPSVASGGTRLILVRHGQTAWNVGSGPERFRGRTDLTLDDAGLAQARLVAARLGTESLSAAYVSPLLRTQQTLEPLASQIGLRLQLHDGLIDIDYGRFRGLTHSEAAAAYPELYTQWRSAPSQVRFPGGESLADVQFRLVSLLDELTTRHPGQTVALAGHQIVNKVLSCTMLGLDLDQVRRIQQDTTGIDIFQQVNDAWHTLWLNDTCHLA